MSTDPAKPNEGVAYETALRHSMRADLTSWATYAVSPLGQRPAAHHLLLLQNLQRLSHDDIDRLMVLMPPGSAKSTYASVLFPAWWFTQHPRSSVIGASHTAALAALFSRRIRDTVLRHKARLGYDICSADRSAAHWTTSSGGEYYATGTHGAVVGRRADLVVIDDPLKSQLEADSVHLRDRIWNWYQSDLSTRLKPRARVVLIMTRWHEDDLGGRLLQHEADDWHVLRLPAMAEAGDPLGRAAGEPLWPEWEGAAALARKRLAVGERAWAALFQQSPRPDAAALFDVGRLAVIAPLADAPEGPTVRAWDLASTLANGDNDPDWTVGLKMTRDPTGVYTVIDVVRFRGGPREVEQRIVSTATSDGRRVRIGLPEDPGQAGRSQMSYMIGQLSGHVVEASRETGSKTLRAMPVASQIDAGNVRLVKAPWNHALIEELRAFPFGRKDDQVDALSRAFAMLLNSAAPARSISLPFMSR